MKALKKIIIAIVLILLVYSLAKASEGNKRGDEGFFEYPCGVHMTNGYYRKCVLN